MLHTLRRFVMLRSVKSMHFYDHELKNFSYHGALLRESTLLTSFLSTGQLQCGRRTDNFFPLSSRRQRAPQQHEHFGRFHRRFRLFGLLSEQFPRRLRLLQRVFFFFLIFFFFSISFLSNEKQTLTTSCVRSRVDLPGLLERPRTQSFLSFFSPLLPLNFKSIETETIMENK